MKPNFICLKKYRQETMIMSSLFSLLWVVMIFLLRLSIEPYTDKIYDYKTYYNITLALRVLLIIIVIWITIPFKKYNKIGYFNDRLKEFDIVNIKYTDEKFHFKKYSSEFFLEYPMLSISTIGLIVNQFYFNFINSISIDILSYIPIIKDICVNAYPLIAVLVFLIINYVKYIKSDLVRRIAKIIVIICSPVAVLELILGLTSVSINPIYELFKTPYSIITLRWYSWVLISIIPVLIIYIIQNSLNKIIDYKMSQGKIKIEIT